MSHAYTKSATSTINPSQIDTYGLQGPLTLGTLSASCVTPRPTHSWRSAALAVLRISDETATRGPGRAAAWGATHPFRGCGQRCRWASVVTFMMSA
jgi:hypothetical protein